MSESSLTSTVAVGRLRAELQGLLEDLDRWDDFRHVDVGRGYVDRARRVRRELVRVATEVPPEFAFSSEDLSRSGQTVREQAADRFRQHVESLARLVPGTPLPWDVADAAGTGKGATPWPTGRIRQELRILLGDLAAWQDYRHVDVAEQFRQRANLLLAQLRRQPDVDPRAFPSPLEFTGADVGDGLTITDGAYRRLVDFVEQLVTKVPSGAGLSAGPTELADLHPAVATAAAAAWQRGDRAGAVSAAISAVVDRLRQRTGLDLPSVQLIETALGTQEPALQVADPATEAGRAEQSGWRHLALGLVLGIGPVTRAGSPVPLPGERAHEMLSVASLLLRRLDLARG